MYEFYYGLREKPFSLLPDPDFLYLGAKHKIALSVLEYGLLNQAGFIVITGEPGTGKTTLLHKILEQSKEDLTIGVLSNTQETLGSLMPWILMVFGLNGKGKDSVELFYDFSEFLLREHARRHRVLLVVDEAQNLSSVMLEELRLLSNANDGKHRTLQIILAGQPPLRVLLKRSEQLAQRVAVDYHLDPMDEEDTKEYIRHRIQVAGGTHLLFTDEACKWVYRITSGVPRLINQVCDTALAYGFAEQSRWITIKILSQAAQDRSQGGVLPLAERPDLSGCSKEQEEAERKQMIPNIVSAVLPPEDVPPLHQAAFHKEPPVTVPPATMAVSRQPEPPRPTIDVAQQFQRGLALKKVARHKEAIKHFERASLDPAYAQKALAQIGLCLKTCGRLDHAIGAFEQALKAPASSSHEMIQVRYMLGRTLETQGRNSEAREAYRLISQEDPAYRDVTDRLNRLGFKRSQNGKKPSVNRRPATHGSWVSHVLDSWNQLIRR
ncbi:MAG: AAA family ATPase [Nitrospiraceae bacterium]